MTSPDGKCHTFDEAANGYCRGEGCGAFVLKRMSDAVRDGDKVYAVIRGSAVMQDGKSASLTAPNGRAQEQLLRSALRDAGVDPNDVRYIEAHGTGTKLGDPIETEALASVFGEDRAMDDPLYVSSVKANIGHLEAAAGMAGMLSAILALQMKQAPPNAQLRVLNENSKARKCTNKWCIVEAGPPEFDTKRPFRAFSAGWSFLNQQLIRVAPVFL